MGAPNKDSYNPVTFFQANPSSSKEVNSLLWFAKWGESGVGTGATVYYSFPTTAYHRYWSSDDYVSDLSSEVYNNFNGLSQSQMQAARSIMQSYSNIANINLVEVSETESAVGDIRIAMSDLGPSAAAYAYLPFTSPVAGDIWINNIQPDVFGLEHAPGEIGNFVMIHEIGHALGLDHPFEGNQVLDTEFDHFQFTVMSYFDTAPQRIGWEASFYPTTPMILDIAALQYLYGANMTYNAGDTLYTYNHNETYYETIWDAGGRDTIYYNSDFAGTINLNTGEFSEVGQGIQLSNQDLFRGNVGIALNTTIENALGGRGNDLIIGSAGNNEVDGNLGSDIFRINVASQSQITNVTPARVMYDTHILNNNKNAFGNPDISDAYVVSSSQGDDTLINVEFVQFSNGTVVSLSDLVSSFPVDIPTGFNAYTGAVHYLQTEFLGTNDDEQVTGGSANDFINLLGGVDAANGGAGEDVIDGGTGSNFLTGGADQDTFFIDGRSGETTWSTITDFILGEQVNIWGWQANTSQVILREINGAASYKGATLHLDLNGNGVIDTSITLTGFSLDRMPELTVSSVEGNEFLLIS